MIDFTLHFMKDDKEVWSFDTEFKYFNIFNIKDILKENNILPNDYDTMYAEVHFLDIDIPIETFEQAEKLSTAEGIEILDAQLQIHNGIGSEIIDYLDVPYTYYEDKNKILSHIFLFYNIPDFIKLSLTNDELVNYFIEAKNILILKHMLGYVELR